MGYVYRILDPHAHLRCASRVEEDGSRKRRCASRAEEDGRESKAIVLDSKVLKVKWKMAYSARSKIVLTLRATRHFEPRLAGWGDPELYPHRAWYSHPLLWILPRICAPLQRTQEGSSCRGVIKRLSLLYSTMLYGILLLQGPFEAQASTPKEPKSYVSVWHNDLGTVAIQPNAQDKGYFVKIGTSAGGHFCTLGGPLQFSGNHHPHLFYPTSKNPAATIRFMLEDDELVVYTSKGNARSACGVHGEFEGVYFRAGHPRRYHTSFNGKTTKSLAEKIISTHKKLADADLALHRLLDEAQSAKVKGVRDKRQAWKAEREACVRKFTHETDQINCLSQHYATASLATENAISGKSDKPYNFKYLKENPSTILSDPALIYYIRSSLPPEAKDYLETHLMVTSEPTIEEKVITLTGGRASLFGISEGALVITAEHGVWLGILEDRKLVVYAPRGMDPKDVPPLLKSWIDAHKKHTDGSRVPMWEVFL